MMEDEANRKNQIQEKEKKDYAEVCCKICLTDLICKEMET